LSKRSAAIGLFGAALPPPMQKVFGRKQPGKNLEASRNKGLQAAKAYKPIDIRV